jgi:hypothetical protein
MEFVFPHARTFYDRVVGQSIADEHARWVSGYILSRGIRVIEARDIYRHYTRADNPVRAIDVFVEDALATTSK